MDFQNHYKAAMMPISFTLATVKESPAFWDTCLQLFFISEGEVDISIDGEDWHAFKRTLLLIPANSVVSVSRGSATVAAFQLYSDAIAREIPSFQTPVFCPMLLTPDEHPYTQQIFDILADIIRASTLARRNTQPLYDMANGIRLLAILSDYCAVDSTQTLNKRSEPVFQALDYILKHYRERIGIEDAARAAGFSVSHFSKRFSETVGVPFSEYLTTLRLQEAERLLNRGETVSTSAVESGFPDSRAFVRAFRKRHNNQNPVQKKSVPEITTAAEPELLSPSAGQVIAICLENLNSDSHMPIRHRHIAIQDISPHHPQRSFPHTWQKSIGVGYAQYMIYGSNQALLRELQQEIGFKQVILHGLLDDEMQVVRVSEDGKLSFFFGQIDLLFDFLTEIRLKPMVQLGFMPSALARDKERYIYEKKSVSSLPVNLKDWTALIHSLILHLFQRYGQSVVEQWEFCLWSKPDALSLPFGMSNMKAYFSFYRATYEAVKDCSKKLRFVSPAFMIESLEESGWLLAFFELCKQHRCMPEKIRFDLYLNRLPPRVHAIAAPNSLCYHTDPDFMRKTLLRAKEFCKKNELPYQQPELEEWNLSISQRELLNDTAFKAAFIVKNILECWDKASDLSYWAFSDVTGENPLPNKNFYGGYGLYTKDRLRKATYYAFQLLSRLGDQLISQEDGYVVTTGHGNIQIMLYNYCHYSDLYSGGDTMNISFTNRYALFTDQEKLHFTLRLTELHEPKYLMSKFRLNRDYGSVFDNWVESGGIEPSGQEELRHLQHISRPQRTKSYVTPVDGVLPLSADLEPFEICLIELHPVASDTQEL